MILSDFVLLDENSGQESNMWAMPPEATQVTLQVTGATSVAVGGIVDEEDAQPALLSVINLADFSVVDEITTDGIYAVGVSGIKGIVVANSGTEGSVKVYGVCVG